MAKILFTHSYFYLFDSKQWSFKQPYPPYATLLVAAWMREKGHEVYLWDANLQENTNGLIEKLKTIQPDYLVVYDDSFNYLTKMCLTTMREACFEMCKYGKKHNATVIVSSSDSTDHYEKYLEQGADIIIRGEAEQTLLEIVENTQSPENIHGVAYKSDNEVKITPKREIFKSLDVLPIPAWDLVDINAYRQIWEKHHGYFMLNIATTRGCPYKCNWCAKPIYGNRYNVRSSERVAEEIEMLVNQFGVNNFWMCDDIFGLKPNWVQEFNKLIQEKQLKIKYKIQSRVDLLLKEDTIDCLVASGLYEAWVGAESASQKILDAMDKGTKVEEIYKATQLLKSKGVRVAFFLQFGYLGEVEEDIQKTIKMVEELLPDNIGISVSYPLPNTKFYDIVKSQLTEKQNWVDSDDLAMMYQATFAPRYYKYLHRYVHRVYRKAKHKYQINQHHTPFAKKIRSLVAYVYHSVIEKVEAKRLKLSK
ncbi:MAG: B12-binding domain-containing radical SAM protein [Raineya sp.]|jgi:anaerobic magnesium-protoporphyrin IX monomethyl ester cyclase|nr:B12-binding domain-containing radical SAM protein [Raineya sp.]